MFKVFLFNRDDHSRVGEFSSYSLAKSFVDEKIKGSELCLLEDPHSNPDICWYEILEFDDNFRDTGDFDCLYISPIFYYPYSYVH